MNRSDRIHIFCTELWSWFGRHKRVLPWRDLPEKNLDHKAYLVLVSEVMLQQTQVSRVIILYKNFIQKFPRIEALAKASNKEILIAWRGLGYNNRSLRLRDAARAITTLRGVFPRDMHQLQDLPGVGHYTAGAIRNFAFGIATPCIDVNIRRILHRFFVGPENEDGTWQNDDRYLLKLAEEVLHCAVHPSSPSHLHRDGDGWRAERAGVRAFTRTTADFHAALMDFGSLVCTKNNPKWHLMSKKMQSACMAYGKEIIRTKKVNKKEPGRMMAGKYVPNRIFRGRIIEALRDARTVMTIEELGAHAITDWPVEDQREWFSGLLKGLEKDGLIEGRRGRWALRW